MCRGVYHREEPRDLGVESSDVGRLAIAVMCPVKVALLAFVAWRIAGAVPLTLEIVPRAGAISVMHRKLMPTVAAARRRGGGY